MTPRTCPDPDETVAALLRRQAGVIGREQARAAGLSPDAVDRRLADRRWIPVHPRVYLARDHTRTDETRVRAALLWAGEGALVSGLAAAWWHGLAPAPPSAITISVPRRRAPRSREGVIVRRRDVPLPDQVVDRGLAVTAAPLAALDAAVELGRAGPAFLDLALQRGVGFDDVGRAHARNLGCHGSAAMGALLAAAADRSAVSAQRLLVRRLREAGLGGWSAGCPVAGVVVGVAFPAARLAVDAAGWAWHLDDTRHRAAQRRRQLLARSGWTLLRYDWHDLTARSAEIVAELEYAVGGLRRAG